LFLAHVWQSESSFAWNSTSESPYVVLVACDNTNKECFCVYKRPLQHYRNFNDRDFKQVNTLRSS